VHRFAVIVIGGGVAGLTAALFLARAKTDVVVFDQAQSSLHRVSLVRNYPGLPDGVSGAELIALVRRQAQAAGAVVRDEDVTTLAREQGGFVATTARGDRYSADYLVLASNKRVDLARALGLTLGGHGDRFVAVDGSGRTALERVFATGRITGAPSQAVIAAGDAARVAVAIIETIRGEYYVDHDT
jgi:thioredoxin reductase (NADPH)